MKTCTKCKIEKPLDEFNNRKLSKDGKQCNCKKCIIEYRQKNKEWKKEYNKKYNKKNKEKLKEYFKQYNQTEKRKEYNKQFGNSETKKEYSRERKKNNPLFKMKCNLRTRTTLAFKTSKWIKNSGNIDMLGCSYEDAFKHIENQFTEGMSWNNHSFYGWHIDHIIPLASAKTEEELKSLCHYTNLQPLWAEENLSKGAKVIY